MKRHVGWLIAAALAAFASPAEAKVLDALILDNEAGPIYLGQNDGRYGANGTLYSADLVAQNRNLFMAQRYSGEARLGGRHRVLLLWAPLDVTTRVQLDQPLVFRASTFAAGSVVDSRYQFEGYRASYLYQFLESPAWSLEFGGTLQIRNALVSFSDVAGTRFAAERDIGLVPALKARIRHTFPEGHYLSLEADGLSSFGIANVQGGILDSALSLGIPLSDRWETFLRLRYLTGGADVKSRQIYNWGQFYSVSTGLRCTLF